MPPERKPYSRLIDGKPEIIRFSDRNQSTLGTFFESLRMSAELSLDGLFQNQRDLQDREDIRVEVLSMLLVLDEMQRVEWGWPYIPWCLVYVCGFAWAQNWAMHAEQGDFGSLWLATENHTQMSLLRGLLLAGLVVSGLLLVWRGGRYGSMVWCKHNLRALIKKVEGDEIVEERDKLEGVQWEALHFYNMQF